MLLLALEKQLLLMLLVLLLGSCNVEVVDDVGNVGYAVRRRMSGAAGVPIKVVLRLAQTLNLGG